MFEAPRVKHARRRQGRAATFVVRIWTPADGEERPPGVHGVAQRVGDDEAQAFRSADELLRMLEATLDAAPRTLRGRRLR